RNRFRIYDESAIRRPDRIPDDSCNEALRSAAVDGHLEEPEAGLVPRVGGDGLQPIAPLPSDGKTDARAIRRYGRRAADRASNRIPKLRQLPAPAPEEAIRAALG